MLSDYQTGAGITSHGPCFITLTKPHTINSNFTVASVIYRGYYTVARRYEFYFRVKYCFCHEKIKFISSSRRVMPFLLYRQNNIDKTIEGNDSRVRLWKINHSGPGCSFYEFYEWYIFQKNTRVYIIKYHIARYSLFQIVTP